MIRAFGLSSMIVLLGGFISRFVPEQFQYIFGFIVGCFAVIISDYEIERMIERNKKREELEK